MKKERGSTRADCLAAIVAVTILITTAMAAIVPAMNKARDLRRTDEAGGGGIKRLCR
ncbi:MAG: hypothetical protein ABR969_03650 [Sedimentisphaerales bacterium]